MCLNSPLWVFCITRAKDITKPSPDTSARVCWSVPVVVNANDPVGFGDGADEAAAEEWEHREWLPYA